ncbi:HAD hydrolase-like protein [Cellulomonas sp. NTE-D12]|uniref:HAD hydrolase-like protein n=1 Tax=Cellulomonas sp. NTE-D12 TaxID=2962632 RepID=UPI003081E7DC|nr:5'-nucleotidase [Cellulomonas sp. NTE-D12]
MSPAPLVLLDLDGTLTDSAPGIVASAQAAYADLGLPTPDAATLRTFVGPPIAGSFLAHGVPAERVGEAIAAYRRYFRAGGMFDNAVFDGVPEALRDLRAAGARLLVATSKPTVFARPIVEHFGLAELLDGVFGAPPDDVPSSKATVIAEALASLGPDGYDPATTLMVGDREHDVIGARAHGIDTLGVAWGYAVPGELQGAGAVVVLDRPAELLPAVADRLPLSPQKVRPEAAPTTGR